jgi:hypothetical protein
VFGDFDSLAWDLGNPDGNAFNNPGPFNTPLLNPITGQRLVPEFHPMKGPMATLSLRGMANHGAMHWRADRTGGNDAPSAQPDQGSFDERAAFGKFGGAFPDLLGRDAPISAAEMDAFTTFMLQVAYPPNPIRPLDNALTPDQEAGRQLFLGTNCGVTVAPGEPIVTCVGCHIIDPTFNPTSQIPGLFGTDARVSFDGAPQLIKTPHLRNLYQKVGMFGFAPNPGFTGDDFDFKGDQVRGFGFGHDGAIDTVNRFNHGFFFSEAFIGKNNFGLPDGPEGELRRRQLEAFMLAFPTNLAPIVGQQITLDATSSAATSARAALLRQRADAGECELVAKAEIGWVEVGFLYAGAGRFRTDRRNQPPVPEAAVRELATRFAHPVTYTCVPPGSGLRIAVDRDGDGFWDGDERAAHSDPADPTSTP